MKKADKSKKSGSSASKASDGLRKPSKLEPIKSKMIKKTNNPSRLMEEDDLIDFDEETFSGFDDYEGDSYDDEDDN